MKRWIPWILVGVFAAWILGGLKVPGLKEGYDVVGFGRLPVLLNGRIQPLDSVARNSLLEIRTKQSVAIAPAAGQSALKTQSLSASEWLLELFANPDKADALKIFRIDHSEVLSMLKLSDAEKYFSFNDLKAQLDEIEKQARRINDVEAAHRTTFERQLMRLYNALYTYHRLKNSVHPEDATDFSAELEQYRAALPAGIAAVQAREKKEKFDEAAFQNIMQMMQRFQRLQEVALPLVVPPHDTSEARDQWANAGLSLLDSARTQTIHPAMTFYAAMLTARHKGDASAFNQAVASYTQWLSQNQHKALQKARSEFYYNHLQLFYRATVIYVAGFLLAAFALFNLTPWLRRSAIGLVSLGLVLHTIGMIYRMVLEGRPPVTNLYSSAVFIGWGAVIFGLALEYFFPDAIGVLVAALIGFVTQVIAHNLSIDGDTMEMLRAVLDTNFWLATHVVTVTLGYSATFVAGLLAAIYVIQGVLAKSLTPEKARSLARMVYAIVCFATLFSFVGTVLGGIWADQSWGRFWGWDPKENGALLIVIWNGAYLHARADGMLRERGLMNWAIGGNIVTAWSWFGVNMLGVGLHSYGFMDSAFKWLLLFVISQVALIALGMLPAKHWPHLPKTTPTQPTAGEPPAAEVKA